MKLRITHGDSVQVRGIREREHVRVDDGVHLFDLSTDIAELHDLLADHPEQARALWDRHAAWLADVGRPDLAERHGARVMAALT